MSTDAKVELRPLVAPPGRLRVWLGVFDAPVRTDDLAWTLGGAAVTPTVVHAMAPVTDQPSCSTRSGVFDLDADPSVTGDHVVGVTVQAGGSVVRRQLATRPVPTSVPDGPTSAFNLMLVSCYFRDNDGGRAGTMVRNELTGLDAPHATLTVGDQVYLDNPWWKPVPLGHDAMASTLERDYRGNWQRGTGGDNDLVGRATFAEVLQKAPVAAIPDDHEYWNNYPHSASFKLQTWAFPFGKAKQNWATTAKQLYDGFQLAVPETYDYWFDVEPLSIYMMDNRTARDDKDVHTLSPAGVVAFKAWIKHVWDADRIPVVITGPSLLQPPKGELAKRLVDRNFSNYQDYAFIIDSLLDFTRRGRSVLALTGDVHYGRVTSAWLGIDAQRGTRAAHLYEVISSPASLVAGKDRQADSAPFTFTPKGTTAKLDCTVLYPAKGTDVRGNHVAMLRFRRTPGGVQLDTRYLLTTRRGATYPRYDAPPIQLYLREP